MKDVLIVSRQRLSGAHNGSSAYLLQIARSLRAAGFVPHLLQPSPSLMGRRPFLHMSKDMRVFESHGVRGVLRIGRLLVSLDPAVYAAAARGVIARLARRIGFTGSWTQDRPRPYAIARDWTAKDRDFVQARGHNRCAFVIADYMFQAEAFDLLGVPRRRCAVLMHDLFHARETKDGDGVDSVAAVSKEDEIAMLGRGGAVIAIQQAEAAFVREHVRPTRVILAPMAAETNVFAPVPGRSDHVLFVGSRTAPNTQGLRWFLDEVWPLVLDSRPDARLHVVGTVCDDFDRDRSGSVLLHGRVDRLEPFYEDAGVVISPLLFGSGLKIKLVEAMGQGKAIVASGATLQGVEEACRTAVIRADDPVRFACGIADLLSDQAKRERLGGAALELARQEFGPQAAHAELHDWLARESPTPKTAGAVPTRTQLA